MKERTTDRLLEGVVHRADGEKQEHCRREASRRSPRNAADGKRPVEMHIKGFDKMSPKLQRALIKMAVAVSDAWEKGWRPEPPNPPRAVNAEMCEHGREAAPGKEQA